MAQGIEAYSYEGICALMKEWGQPRFRAKQLMQWLYQKGVDSYDDMSNLPAALKERLENEALCIVPRLSISACRPTARGNTSCVSPTVPRPKWSPFPRRTA